MKRQHNFILALATFLVMAVLTTEPSRAVENTAGETFVGVKAGLVGSGDVVLGSIEVEQDYGLAGGLFFDQPLGERFHYGFTADFIGMNWETFGPDDGIIEETKYLLDLGINVKGNFGTEQSPLVVRPGVGLGFGVLSKMQDFGLSGSNYLTLKGSLELAYFTAAGPAFLVDATYWYAPSGGDDIRDVEIGPLILIRGGVMF